MHKLSLSWPMWSSKFWQSGLDCDELFVHTQYWHGKDAAKTVIVPTNLLRPKHDHHGWGILMVLSYVLTFILLVTWRKMTSGQTHYNTSDQQMSWRNCACIQTLQLAGWWKLIWFYWQSGLPREINFQQCKNGRLLTKRCCWSAF